MLSNLLPGLRDVRTPLAVGYLWLTLAYLLWGDSLPDERPTGDGPVARLFDLSDFLGSTAVIASISFIAYVLGTLVSLPVEGRLAGLILRTMDRALHPFTWRDMTEWNGRGAAAGRDLLRSLKRQFPELDRFGPPDVSDRLYVASLTWEGQPDESLMDAYNATADTLRVRLLASDKTEVYGEYDRLASEAAFRINLVIPVLAFGVYASFERNPWYLLMAAATASGLLWRGSTRLDQSRETLLRAAIVNVYEHPLAEEARHRQEEARRVRLEEQRYLEEARSRQHGELEEVTRAARDWESEADHRAGPEKPVREPASEQGD